MHFRHAVHAFRAVRGLARNHGFIRGCAAPYLGRPKQTTMARASGRDARRDISPFAARSGGLHRRCDHRYDDRVEFRAT